MQRNCDRNCLRTEYDRHNEYCESLEMTILYRTMFVTWAAIQAIHSHGAWFLVLCFDNSMPSNCNFGNEQFCYPKKTPDVWWNWTNSGSSQNKNSQTGITLHSHFLLNQQLVLRSIYRCWCMVQAKAVGRCFRLGGPSAKGARTVQVGRGACSPRTFLISDSETRFPAFWGEF